MIRRVLPLGILAVAGAVSVAAAEAQVSDSSSAPVPQNCVLQWGAVPGRAAPALRHTESPDGEVADFFSGRTRFTCGTATMEADSAVSYDTRGEVYLVGDVAYQDSVRSLDSEFLTYYERADLIVASGDVRLVRQADNSTLEGPRVEFLRAVSGVDELTIARGRPHMTFYPEGDEPGEPFDVDADRIVFAGEDEARAYGEVLIERSDLTGEADSIRLTRIEEMGWMWGDPWIDAEDVRLEGDTIRFRSEEEALKEVHAIGEGRAIGESFEVIGEIIDVALTDDEPERVWAHGEGLSRAISGGHDLYGDSLEFAMFESSIDTVYAIGEAVAVSGGDVESTESEPSSPPDTVDPAAVDSTALATPDSTAVLVSDSTAVPVSDSTAVPVSDSTAVPVSDSTAAPVPDSTAAPVPDSTAVLVRDSTAAPVPESTPAATPDSVPGPATDPAVGDSLATDPAEDVAMPVLGRVLPPYLPMDGDAIWVKGDTLIGVFERPAAEGDSSAVASELSPSPDVAAAPTTLAEGALSGADSLAIVEAGPVSADSSSDPVMERLIVIGNARAFYSQIRDSTKTMRHSKNYMIAKRIDVFFEDGDPARVTGVEAIGVFLDPQDDGSRVPAAGAPGIPPALPPEGVTLPDSVALPDSAGAAIDTTGTPPDTTGAPPDTTVTGRGKVGASPPSLRGSFARGGGSRAYRAASDEDRAPAFAAARSRRGTWWRE